MVINSAEFIKSSTKTSDCPQSLLPEFAFIGRSNVGKSTLINMLINQRKLAKTSSTPGKTQLINHFLINESWYLVDLPGLGFAKAPIKEKKKWEKMLKEYLLQRKQLMCTFFLVDIRHSAQKIDMEFMKWMGTNQLPFAIIFTKTDKLSKNKINKNINNYLKQLSEDWEPLPPVFVSSGIEAVGRDEILSYIDDCQKLFNNNTNYK